MILPFVVDLNFILCFYSSFETRPGDGYSHGYGYEFGGNGFFFGYNQEFMSCCTEDWIGANYIGTGNDFTIND